MKKYEVMGLRRESQVFDGVELGKSILLLADVWPEKGWR